MTGETNHDKIYPLRTIYFYLTEGCNLACRHCWIAPVFQRYTNEYSSLDLALFKSIINQAQPLGLCDVKLTGGEPLLHPRIDEMLEFIHEENLGLIMETNGVLCTPQLAKSITQCRDPSISVSLDGTDADTHEWVRGVPGCFDEAIRGLTNLIEAGLKPQIIMTIMRRNRAQMASMVKMAEKLGAGSVKFNLVQPTARGETIYSQGEALTIDEMVAVGGWIENELSASTSIPVFYDHPIAFRPMGKMFGDSGNGCAVCRIKTILGVLSDGSYALCGIGANIPDLVFGHAAIDRLEDVWQNSPILQDLRQNLPDHLEGICDRCIMKNICLGSCIAQNYYSTKNLWAPHWFCTEAEKAGLFPQSRIK
ncbi:MAG: SynChlorMet cassette radical SAM/SPASM protein ScmF [Methanotrichaceae archaeon]|nr:SynChlorMet cassette radical SAM/SPASM protein ScmF [Methanotrichaceae archaeon]